MDPAKPVSQAQHRQGCRLQATARCCTSMLHGAALIDRPLVLSLPCMYRCRSAVQIRRDFTCAAPALELFTQKKMTGDLNLPAMPPSGSAAAPACHLSCTASSACAGCSWVFSMHAAPESAPRNCLSRKIQAPSKICSSRCSRTFVCGRAMYCVQLLMP